MSEAELVTPGEPVAEVTDDLEPDHASGRRQSTNRVDPGAGLTRFAHALARRGVELVHLEPAATAARPTLHEAPVHDHPSHPSAPTAPTSLTAARLRAAAALARSSVATSTDDGVPVEPCLMAVTNLSHTLYPLGVRAAVVRDDTWIGTRTGRLYIASPQVWPLVASQEAFEQAVRAQGPGATGFYYLGRPTGIASGESHASALYVTHDQGPLWALLTAADELIPPGQARHTARQWAAGQTGPFESAVQARGLIVDPNGTVVAEPFPPMTESQSIARAITDAPVNRRYGAAALEVEAVRASIKFPPGRRPADYPFLVKGPNIRIVPDGMNKTVPEVVSSPWRVLPAERGWASRDAVLAEVEDALSRIFRASYRGTKLGRLFPVTEGFEFHEDAAEVVLSLLPHRRATARGGPRADNLYVQYTVGLALDGLLNFLMLALEHAPAIDEDLATRHLSDGLDFGFGVAQLMGEAGFEPQRPMPHTSAAGLAGFMALIYTQAAARINQLQTGGPFPTPNVKNYAHVLSRTSLHGLFRAGPKEIQIFAEVFADWLDEALDTHFQERNADLLDHLPAWDDLVVSRTRADGAELNHTIRQYILNAWLPDPPVLVRQGDAFGGMTAFDEADDNDGNLTDHPLAVLELRAFGEYNTDRLEVGWDSPVIEQEVIRLHEEAERAAALRPASPATAGRIGVGAPSLGLPSAKRAAFLRLAALASARRPAADEVDPARLDDGTVTDGSGVGRVNPPSAGPITVPHLVHVVGLGGVPDDAALAGLAALGDAASAQGFQLVLWTDVERQDFATAAADAQTRWLRHVARLRSTTAHHNIAVVNIHDVFDDAAPMVRFGQAVGHEVMRADPHSLSRAAKVARAEILHRFGGVSVDLGLALVGPLAPSLSLGAAGLSVAEVHGRTGLATVIVAAANSTGTKALLDVTAERYRKPLADLVAEDDPTNDLTLADADRIHQSDTEVDPARETLLRTGLTRASLDATARRLQHIGRHHTLLVGTHGSAFAAGPQAHLVPRRQLSVDEAGLEQVWPAAKDAAQVLYHDRVVRPHGVFLAAATPIVNTLAAQDQERTWRATIRLLRARLDEDGDAQVRWISAHGVALPVRVIDELQRIFPGAELTGLLRSWLAAPDWPASYDFYERHLGPAASAVAHQELGVLARADPDNDEYAVHQALLDLGDLIGHGFRYLYVAEPDDRRADLIDILDQKPEMLPAVSQLTRAHAEEPDEVANWAVLDAVANALAGQDLSTAVRTITATAFDRSESARVDWGNYLRRTADQNATAATSLIRLIWAVADQPEPGDWATDDDTAFGAQRPVGEFDVAAEADGLPDPAISALHQAIVADVVDAADGEIQAIDDLHLAESHLFVIESLDDDFRDQLVGAGPQPEAGTTAEMVRHLLALPHQEPVDEQHRAVLDLLARSAITGGSGATVTRAHLHRLAGRIHLSHQDGILDSLLEGAGGRLWRSRSSLARLREIGVLALRLRRSAAADAADAADAGMAIAELQTVRRLFDLLRHEYGDATSDTLHQLAYDTFGIDPGDVTPAHERALLDLVGLVKSKGVQVRVTGLRAGLTTIWHTLPVANTLAALGDRYSPIPAAQLYQLLASDLVRVPWALLAERIQWLHDQVAQLADVPGSSILDGLLRPDPGWQLLAEDGRGVGEVLASIRRATPLARPGEPGQDAYTQAQRAFAPPAPFVFAAAVAYDRAMPTATSVVAHHDPDGGRARLRGQVAAARTRYRPLAESVQTALGSAGLRESNVWLVWQAVGAGLRQVASQLADAPRDRAAAALPPASATWEALENVLLMYDQAVSMLPPDLGVGPMPTPTQLIARVSGSSLGAPVAALADHETADVVDAEMLAVLDMVFSGAVATEFRPKLNVVREHLSGASKVAWIINVVRLAEGGGEHAPTLRLLANELATCG